MTKYAQLWMSKRAIRGDQSLRHLASVEGAPILEQLKSIYGPDHQMFAAARQKPFNAQSLAQYAGKRPIGTAVLEEGFANQAKRNMLAALLKSYR